MTTPKSREGQPNPDAAIVEAALERAPLPDTDEPFVWNALHKYGMTASQIAASLESLFPDFAATLREGIAARRGQRHGGHGGKG